MTLEAPMTTTCDPLVLDLVQWVARAPRTYAEVIDAWRTSCPRLTVWEDAVDLGYVTRRSVGARGTIVVVTAAGRALLDAQPAATAINPRTIARKREPAVQI
jgi:hypothetical protein